MYENDMELEDPAITRTLRTGYPEPQKPMPVCPVCGAETDTFVVNRDGQVVGCDECCQDKDAWEVCGI